MKRLLLLAVLGLAACTSSPSTKGNTCEQTVTIAGFAFSPTPITVKKGSCVTFKNTDATTHNVHVDTGSGVGAELVGDLGLGSSGDTAALNAALSYVCGIHSGMKGRIEVQ